MPELPQDVHVPPELHRYVDDTFLQGHEVARHLNRDNLERFCAEYPERYDSVAGMGYVDILPQGHVEPTEALVVGFPYANGWALNMAHRIRLVQLTASYARRIVAFPNNVLRADGHAYGFSPVAAGELQRGVFDDIAARQIGILHALGIERISYLGYSQGAAVGAAVLKALQPPEIVQSQILSGAPILEADGAVLAEPPNTQQRTRWELLRDFARSSGNFNRSVRNAGLPLQNEIQAVNPGFTSSVRQTAGLVRFGMNALLPPNRLIFDAFRKGTFCDTVVMAAHHMSAGRTITVVSAENGIMGPHAWRDLKDELMGEKQHVDGHKPLNMHLRLLRLSGEDHSAADNLLTHVLFARMLE